MHFKLICAFVQDDKTNAVMNAARIKGATGVTVITSAHGEGLKVRKTFLGLSLETQRDVILFLVEEHLSREILESIATVGEFDVKPGTGIAFQVDVEDAVGVAHQMVNAINPNPSNAGYAIVMVQTLFAPRMIIPLAYDSGGVTTSTVTVPLVAALGLGLASTVPGRNPVFDGFGLIAFASLFPIISVMAYAQISAWWAKLH